MQFYKNKVWSLKRFRKNFIKIIFITLVLLIGIILVDRIDFPSPNKKIEKIVPNENLRIIK